MVKLARVRTSTLEVAYEDSGPADALPVVLLHGYAETSHMWLADIT